MRRQLMRLCIAGSMIAASLSPYPAAASSRMISLAFNSQTNAPQQFGSDEFRKKLLALPDKRFVVDYRGNGALGSENVVLAAARSGAVDMAVISGGVVSSVVPELGVFDVPFLFRDVAHAKAVAQGPIGSQIAAKFADKGLTLLALGKQGFRNITNSKRPVRSPADLKGLKIRVIPNDVYLMAFKALGAEVVPMEFPLVYAALKDGRLDGQENPVPTIANSRFYEVQKHLTLTGHVMAPIAFVANRAMFEQLDSDDQAALIVAAKAAAEVTWQAELDAPRLEQVRKGGMDVVEKIDRQPFLDALKPLDQEFEKRFGKDLIAAIRSTR